VKGSNPVEVKVHRKMRWSVEVKGNEREVMFCVLRSNPKSLVVWGRSHTTQYYLLFSTFTSTLSRILGGKSTTTKYYFSLSLRRRSGYKESSVSPVFSFCVLFLLVKSLVGQDS
jgi:hypothetical protein